MSNGRFVRRRKPVSRRGGWRDVPVETLEVGDRLVNFGCREDGTISRHVSTVDAIYRLVNEGDDVADWYEIFLSDGTHLPPVPTGRIVRRSVGLS